MDNIKLDITKVEGFVPRERILDYKEETNQHLKTLHNKTGKGNDYLGWLDLPSTIKPEDIKEINETAQYLRQKIDVLVGIGIGGSYLGAKAVIEGLSSSFEGLKSERKDPVILFAGTNIGEDYLYELREILKEKSYAIVVISKSGTTTEPAIAFRVLKKDLEERYGEDEAKNRIIAITDDDSGALRKLSDNNGYRSFIIPDDIGGRFSVLTPVGLLPIAIAGKNIELLIQGARSMQQLTGPDIPFEENMASIYAATRNELYKRGKKIEILANYNPKLQFLSEWWKQLYGESEGKEHKGIFPTSVHFTTDLHSLGQYIQEGERILFETVLSVDEPDYEVSIPDNGDNLDELDYIKGRRLNEINKMAELGTILAHVEGHVPNIKISIPKLTEYYLGQLIYFFEKACAISGYLLGVNPFNQPGVEAYKRNMFALLEKPGFEEETQKVKVKL